MGGLHSMMTSCFVKDIKVGCISWLGPPSAIQVFTQVKIQDDKLGPIKQCS